MRKTRRFNGEDGSSVNEKGEKRYTAMPGEGSAEPTKPLPRERIISKKELEKSGFTNLTDFLNAEKGLKRKNAPKAAATEDNRGDVNEEFKRPLKGLDKAASTAKPKRESLEDVTAGINKNVKSKGFEDALSYALPAAALGAAGAAAYKYGTKGLMKKAAEFIKPTEKVVEKIEPYMATKAQEAAKKGVATKARRAAAKKEAEAGADEARMGGEGGGFKRGGKIRRFAAGGEVAAKKTPEPPIPKATQESMRRQAAQEKADRKQAEEQKAGEREVRENMGRKFFAKGGSVSSASRRADGCAIRGKTRA